MRLMCIQCLLQGIQHKIGLHAGTDSPANDPSRKHLDHEGHVQPASPGRHIREVRHPQLILSDRHGTGAGRDPALRATFRRPPLSARPGHALCPAIQPGALNAQPCIWQPQCPHVGAASRPSPRHSTACWFSIHAGFPGSMRHR